MRVLPGHHGFRAPLYVPGDDLVDALRLVEAVGRSRPLRLVMGRFADEYIRDILRHVDGRGQWSVSALLLVDPAARARLPRWVDALDADLPDTWLVGVSTVDERRPVVRVRHGDRIAMLVRDPMIAAVRI